MYAARVGCRHPTSVSTDWPPCLRTDVGGNLRATIGDALMEVVSELLFLWRRKWVVKEEEKSDLVIKIYDRHDYY